MAEGEGKYTKDDKFIEAFRKFNKYDDAWVNAWFDGGEEFQKLEENMSGSGFKDDGFQGGPA